MSLLFTHEIGLIFLMYNRMANITMPMAMNNHNQSNTLKDRSTSKSKSLVDFSDSCDPDVTELDLSVDSFSVVFSFFDVVTLVLLYSFPSAIIGLSLSMGS